jgi:rare lipoprotein A
MQTLKRKRAMQLQLCSRQGIATLFVTSLLALSGCSSVRQTIPPVADNAAKRQPASSSRGLPALPPAGSGRGGYYQEDGPGDRPPDGLLDMPDAEPKIEPYSKRGNQPYVVFGKRYAPFSDDRPFRQRGFGSWYGKKFHGQRTSSGEIYDMYKMTAAHPTLPIPSYARVTNVGNGTQVIVRVNDRGPFHSDRIIDLSYTAALKLGYVARGSTELEIERLLPDEISRITRNNQNRPYAATAVAAATTAPLPVAAPMVEVVSHQERPQIVVSEAAPRPSGPAEGVASSVSLQANRSPEAPAAVTAGAIAGAYYLQLGAYTLEANAEAVRNQLAQNWTKALPLPEVAQNGAFYRIYSGPFASRGEADLAARQIESAGAARPVVVQR